MNTLLNLKQSRHGREIIRKIYEKFQLGTLRNMCNTSVFHKGLFFLTKIHSVYLDEAQKKFHSLLSWYQHFSHPSPLLSELVSAPPAPPPWRSFSSLLIPSVKSSLPSSEDVYPLDRSDGG